MNKIALNFLNQLMYLLLEIARDSMFKYDHSCTDDIIDGTGLSYIS